MSQLKMTKLELRSQQIRLGQLEKYLPTLQLKKGLLQMKVLEQRQECCAIEQELATVKEGTQEFAALLLEPLSFDFAQIFEVKGTFCSSENIAGIDLPVFEEVSFAELHYSLFATPVWLDGVIRALRRLHTLRLKGETARIRKEKLEKELQNVTTRVNLFEKILIPRTEQMIRKIAVFLGDLQLAAVSRSKVAKAKINERKDACRT